MLRSKRKQFSFSIMADTEGEFLAILKQRGYKVTPQRQAVLRIIALSQHHLSPGEIYEVLRREQTGIGLVTIYRTLKMLAQLGLICEVHLGDARRTYFMRRPSGHHHHLICSKCGDVLDFSGCDLGELERRLSDETGFEIEGHLLEFLGNCQSCQSKVV